MKTIWKFPLMPGGWQEVLMPKGAKPLAVGEQLREVVVWALVNSDAPKEPAYFQVVATGETISFPWETWEYVGTVKQTNSLVWHVWYLPHSLKSETQIKEQDT